MHPNIEELAKETMALDIEDRALLASKLLLNSEESKPSEVVRVKQTPLLLSLWHIKESARIIGVFA